MSRSLCKFSGLWYKHKHINISKNPQNQRHLRAPPSKIPPTTPRHCHPLPRNYSHTHQDFFINHGVPASRIEHQVRPRITAGWRGKPSESSALPLWRATAEVCVVHFRSFAHSARSCAPPSLRRSCVGLPSLLCRHCCCCSCCCAVCAFSGSAAYRGVLGWLRQGDGGGDRGRNENSSC